MSTKNFAVGRFFLLLLSTTPPPPKKKKGEKKKRIEKNKTSRSCRLPHNFVLRTEKFSVAIFY